MAPQSPQTHHHHRHHHGHHPVGVQPEDSAAGSVGALNGAEQHPASAAAADEAARWNSNSVAVWNGGSGGEKIKCVFIGDGAVGKTSLIVSYTTNGYPSEYVPTAIDTYDVVVNVDGVPVTFEMCDTPGQDDFDTLRPLCYPNTDVFLVCFSVVSPSSFTNIREKWIPELKKSYGGSSKKKHIPPLVLVGTQSDLREDVTTLVELARTKEHPVSEQDARRLSAQLGCECYVESSSLTQKNLKEVFDEAIVAGLKGRRKKERRAAKKASRQQQQQEQQQQRSGCLGGTKKCSIM